MTEHESVQTTEQRPYVTGSQACRDWLETLKNCAAPREFKHCLPAPRIIAGSISLVGGAPGVGKTAITMECAVEALRRDLEARLLIANVEMPVRALLDRQLARISGVPAEHVRSRTVLPEHQQHVQEATEVLASVAKRMTFMQGRFTVESLADAVVGSRAGIVVLDYVQRVSSSKVTTSDPRLRVAAVMETLRQLADSGVAVLAVAALSRGRDAGGGSAYSGSGVSLASFRDSSDLEYGADDAYFLLPAGPRGGGRVRLLHEKCRYGATRDHTLIFDGAHQRFGIAGGLDSPHAAAADACGEASATSEPPTAAVERCRGQGRRQRKPAEGWRPARRGQAC